MAVRLEHRVPPPIVAAATAALMLGAAWLLPFLGFGFELKTAFAIALACAGVLVSLTGVAQFWRARTTVNPLQPHSASALVVAGIYRWTRNPMYLGMATVLTAWGIYLANIGALAGVALFVACMNRFQIAPEERALEARFGADFEAYRARVRRWI